MKSPLTTIFGVIAVIGAAILAACIPGGPTADIIKPDDVPHWLKIAGLLCSIVGGKLAFFFARDNGVSDEAAGAKEQLVSGKGQAGGCIAIEILILIAAIALLTMCMGCASAKQFASSSETTSLDPHTGVVSSNRTQTAHSSIIASGNAKQAIESMKGSAGKTVSIGTSGASQESNQSELVKSIFEGLQNLFNAGVEAGKKTAVLP